jgi:hypothetical protein
MGKPRGRNKRERMSQSFRSLDATAIYTQVAGTNIEKSLTRCRESRKKLLITSPDVSTHFRSG